MGSGAAHPLFRLVGRLGTSPRGGNTGGMSLRPFIPPYLLRELARSQDAEVAARASETLAADAEFRRRRRERTIEPDAAARPVAAGKPPRDDGTGPSRSIHDAGGAQSLPGRPVRLEGAPATKDVAVDEAYDGLGATWALWSEVFGRDSLDDHGEALIGTVHFGKGYDNAFWNGTQMVFGDGDGVVFGRFTAAVDVIGHELAHAVTERTAGLVYDGQSGALNEHLSDVFGTLVKQRLLGQTASEADWLIGAGLLLPGVQGTAIRSMSHPGTAYDDPRLGKDPQPDSMAGYVETTSDNGGVHVNSGIPNRAFHLVATTLGGNAWDAPGLIWYDTMLGPIKPDCDFAAFAALTFAAASERYGADSRESKAVSEAWASVGVRPAKPKARKAPASKKPVAGQLTVTRTGGFAGVHDQRSVALADLPDADRRAWTKALRAPELADPDPAPGWPDAFCYEITCTQPQVDVQLPEHALPDHVRELAQQFLDEL